MKKVLIVGFGLLSFSLFATESWRDGERVPLWPEGKIPDFQPHQIGAMTDEVGDRGFKRAEHAMPYIEWFSAPTNANGACMILVSGGSYECCCDVRLIWAWRTCFTALGFQTVNLVYRTPRPKNAPCHRSGWQDGQRAVRLVRAAAKERGFDPERIGVIGMSAGGHLVTMLATSALTPSYEKVDALDDLPCHVNWCVANAPAYNTETAASGAARPQDGTLLLDELKVNPSFKFDAKTCPISFHHGAKDPYTPNGSTLCYRELRKLKVPAELHLYAGWGHGAHGLDRAVEFLHQMNFDGTLGKEEERRIFTGDHTLRQEKELLWPDGNIPWKQASQTNAPFMTWYVPKVLKTKAIQVVLPGGAYCFCNAKGEGLPVAEYFNAKGMTVVIVEYRCPRPPKGVPKHWTAWQDAQRAIRLVRYGAEGRGLDPDRIGVMGFSAGGHLALMTALSSTYSSYSFNPRKPVHPADKLSCKVQWACPIYPAYALTDGADSPNRNGGNLDDAQPVPEFLFDINTPPMCFIHGDADGWSAMNSVKIWERLRRMGVQCDLHTLATRGHCFQFKAAPGTGSYTWLNQVWSFLSRKGFNK